MINIDKISQDAPFKILVKKYNKAIESSQNNIDAIAISSFNFKKNCVDSRYVNLKFIIDDEFIFFSNYNSPKSKAFDTHNQISALLYWPTINLQIRMKAKIKRTSNEFNQKYFFERSEKKNALAISSNQSQPISSYEKVKDNYYKSLNNDDLKKCPDFWGGFSFKPHEIEFWEGNKYRLNRRDLYSHKENKWSHVILEP